MVRPAPQGVILRHVVSLLEPLRKHHATPELKLDDVLTADQVERVLTAHGDLGLHQRRP
ncbi:hypothetical protein P0W64_12990 [Tsukamurella sp. 8F]|uniref:hypothetical protein n=1 Tax=unclassified Tsukamurella TaxID=2633480 RepID=UPI0023B94320|nr:MULTISPECIES: hypothetical protein [unclassified Tsukamurella]MDF0530488.1 hypothetical protein [Tsukamurella sp. 8J]MDF0587691.1 hypothetical protein [Tsukamurella sp. 8F]